jgi:hypothetical protein
MAQMAQMVDACAGLFGYAQRQARSRPKGGKRSG